MATILPENQINQELNSSAHQFLPNRNWGRYSINPISEKKQTSQRYY